MIEKIGCSAALQPVNLQFYFYDVYYTEVDRSEARKRISWSRGKGIMVMNLASLYFQPVPRMLVQNFSIYWDSRS